MTKKVHPIDAYIGARCREARQAAKLRLEDVGDALKISGPAIHQQESGGTRIAWDTLTKLAQLYSKRLPWFFDGAPGF